MQLNACLSMRACLTLSRSCSLSPRNCQTDWLLMTQINAQLAELQMNNLCRSGQIWITIACSSWPERSKGLAMLNTEQRATSFSGGHGHSTEGPPSPFLGWVWMDQKSFLYNQLLKSVKADGEIALAIGSSQVAAIHLQSGQPAQKLCEISIPIDQNYQNKTCKLKANYVEARLVRRAKLIIVKYIIADQISLLQCLTLHQVHINLPECTSGQDPITCLGTSAQVPKRDMRTYNSHTWSHQQPFSTGIPKA